MVGGGVTFFKIVIYCVFILFQFKMALSDSVIERWLEQD